MDYGDFHNDTTMPPLLCRKLKFGNASHKQTECKLPATTSSGPRKKVAMPILAVPKQMMSNQTVKLSTGVFESFLTKPAGQAAVEFGTDGMITVQVECPPQRHSAETSILIALLTDGRHTMVATITNIKDAVAE